MKMALNMNKDNFNEINTKVNKTNIELLLTGIENSDLLKDSKEDLLLDTARKITITGISIPQDLTSDEIDYITEKNAILVASKNLTMIEDMSGDDFDLDTVDTEIISNLSNNISKTTAFICDEYDKYASKTDGEFFSLSREAKCINIVATQSYSSLKSTLKDDSSVRVLLQNLINKIWFRTDDTYTIEEAQKQLGKEEKQRISKSISESAKETRFSYITNTLNSENSNISETYSTYSQNDYKYDTDFFTQNLETFTALTFLSDGNKIFPPKKI